MGLTKPTQTFHPTGLKGCAASSDEGFTLIEMLISLFVLTFGLLAAGQLIYVAMASASLARSKGSAVIVGENKLEFLADLYRQNPSAGDLTLGNHGPEQAQVVNPADGTILNRFNVAWVVSTVPDPRVGKVLASRLVRVTSTPLTTGGVVNRRTSLNKEVSVTAIFSPRVE